MRLVTTPRDRRLGMGSAITRRDFMNGVAIGVGGALATANLSSELEAWVAQDAPYPPALMVPVGLAFERRRAS